MTRSNIIRSLSTSQKYVSFRRKKVFIKFAALFKKKNFPEKLCGIKKGSSQTLVSAHHFCKKNIHIIDLSFVDFD